MDDNKSNAKENDRTSQIQVRLTCCNAFVLSVPHIIMGISTALGMTC